MEESRSAGQLYGFCSNIYCHELDKVVEVRGDRTDRCWKCDRPLKISSKPDPKPPRSANH